MRESSFSERFGYVPPPVPLGKDDFPDALRNGLWDVCRLRLEVFFHPNRFREEVTFRLWEEVTFRLWHDFFQIPADSRPRDAYGLDRRKAVQFIRKFFFEREFYKVYDLIEFLLNDLAVYLDRQDFDKALNTVLERESAAYRLINARFVSVTDPAEVESITAAAHSEVDGVRQHITRSAELLSDRQKPDYRNAIKEAISAVEAAVAFVSGESTGGVKNLSKVEELKLHPALCAGFEKTLRLYL